MLRSQVKTTEFAQPDEGLTAGNMRTGFRQTQAAKRKEQLAAERRKEVFSVKRTALESRAGLYTVPQPFSLSTDQRGRCVVSHASGRAWQSLLMTAVTCGLGCAYDMMIVCIITACLTYVMMMVVL